MNKLKLICEICGCETEQLEIRKRFLYCKECADAKKRRDQFKKNEIEWNKAIDPSELE